MELKDLQEKLNLSIDQKNALEYFLQNEYVKKTAFDYLNTAYNTVKEKNTHLEGICKSILKELQKHFPQIKEDLTNNNFSNDSKSRPKYESRKVLMIKLLNDNGGHFTVYELSKRYKEEYSLSIGTCRSDMGRLAKENNKDYISTSMKIKVKRKNGSQYQDVSVLCTMEYYNKHILKK